MADQTKGTSRSIYIDSSAAEAAMRRLQTEGDKLKAKIDAGELAGKNMNKELAKLDQVNEKIKSVQQQLDGGMKPTLIQQQNLVRQLGNELARLSESDPAFKAKLENYKKQNAELAQMRDRLYKISDAEQSIKEHAGGFEKVFTHVAEAITSFFIIEKVADGLKELFTGSIEEADQAAEAVDGLRVALTNAGRLDVFERLIGKADEFAEKYKRLDNDDITKVFTKLVDYGRLTEKQMTAVTDVIINFAAKQRISLEDSTNVITKALEGSGKELKTYGINIKEAKNFTERYSQVITVLGEKVRGAEAAFEETNKGIREGFQQRLRDIKEDIGKFLYSLTGLEQQHFKTAVAAAKDASEAGNLLARYQELSQKTHLTTAEKKELEKITTTLASKFGDSVIEVDKETGALKLNVQATKDLIAQKLLLANSKAVEIAGKLNKAQEDEAANTEKNTKNAKLYNQALKDLGTTQADINKKISVINAGGASVRVDERSPEEKQLDSFIGVINETGEAAKKNRKDIADYTKQLEQLGFSADQVNKLLNPQSDNKPIGIVPPKLPSAEELKKAEENRAKLKELVREMQKSINESALPPLEAAEKNSLLELQKDLAEILKTTAGNTQADIDAAIATAQLKSKDNFLKEFRKLHKIVKETPILIPPPSFDEKEFEKNLKSQTLKPGGIVDRVTSFFRRDKIAKDKLAILKAEPGSKEELQARLNLLREEQQKEIESTEHSEAEIAEIRTRYRQQENQLIVEHFADKVKQYLQFAQQLIGIFDQINQAQNNRENAQLQADIKNNDRRRKDIEKLSKSKVITEIEAKRQIAAIDQEEQKKKDELEKKQLERGRRIAIAQALVNGAMGITAVLAAKPGIADILSLSAFRAINIAFTVATTAAQIAAISGQKFAKGGIPDGASHSEGGIKLFDTKSKRVVGEMEGGEPYMILSKNFRRNNPDFIAAALDSSMNRNGARIRPFWQARPYSHLSYKDITASQSFVRRFENGGIVPSSSGNSSSGNQPIITQGDEEMKTILRAVLERLENPVAPNVTFSLSQLEDAQAQKVRIINEATA
ncbi:MAG: hypothetical protein JO301_16965 [Chitinophagaceae bacterium]|nr:hypothetical protein [Chitinophagaceae bacterium]